jgi:hypothetical protein
MSKTLKNILIVLSIVVLVGAGWLIGRGGGGGGIEKSVPFTLTVNVAGDFEISITPADQSCTKGQSVSYAITAVPSGGFDAPIWLSITGLPDGSYVFTRNPVEPGAWTTTLTINSALLQSNTTYACNLTAVDE